MFITLSIGGYDKKINITLTPTDVGMAKDLVITITCDDEQ